MANCCAITYIVFSGIAAILAITACFVPILSIVDTNYDDDGMMRKLPGSAIASHTKPSKRVASAESITEAQCPVFSGQCSGIRAYQYSTSEFLDQYGCKGGLTTARALCVLFIVFTCVSVLSQFLAINNLRNVRRAKISTSLTGSAGLICGVVGAYNQLNISQCLRNNYYFTGTYDGAFMVMISAIVILVGCAFHFFSTLGMIASWWCGCCGDQPGSYYNQYNLAPGQQGAAMYYNQQVPLNQQQPIVGSVVPPQPQVPLGYPQPGGYQQQPVGYAQQGGYQQQPTGNPQQQVGYPPQQQVYQQPQQPGYQYVSAQGAVHQQPPQQQQTYQQRFSTTQ